MDTYKKFKEFVTESKNIVFLGGAGVSTASGIPDFRSGGGIYNQKYDYPAEYMLSLSFFYENPDIFYSFYKKNMLFINSEPNMAHVVLAKLEKENKLKAVITQNIDELHQKAGSINVLELHGTVYDNYCIKCNKHYYVEHIINSPGVPLCTDCGEIVKPDVVLYGEQLDQDVLKKACIHIRDADLLIVGGTSLTVYPAAGLVDYLQKGRLVLINKTETHADSRAEIVLRTDIAEAFSALLL